jgi:hypothetical protein
MAFRDTRKGRRSPKGRPPYRSPERRRPYATNELASLLEVWRSQPEDEEPDEPFLIEDGYRGEPTGKPGRPAVTKRRSKP